MASFRTFAARGIAFAALCIGPALAQDLPPVAAPTTTVAVGALPIVSSESEQIDDFASGLIRGLMSTNRVAGTVFVAVKADHVMAARGFGNGIDADAGVAVPCLTDVLRAVAIMQLVEQGRVGTDDDVSKGLGETGLRGVTVAQALLRQADPDVLARIVEKISGEAFPTYVMKHIFAPLGMTRSGYGDRGFTTTANDVSRFLLALVNGGAWGQGRILLPETVDKMQNAHASAEAAIPGQSYGFAEIGRNGWRALQNDGAGSPPVMQSRVVIAPEAKLAYLIAVMGRADGPFWRTLDESVYDRLLPPRAYVSALTAPAPGATEAGAASGTYIPAWPRPGAPFLKVLHRPLYAKASGDGSIVLSGGENATLLPHAGGYWLSAGTELPAVYRGGRLLVGDIAYVPYRLWERPGLYAWLAVLTGLAAIMAFAEPAKMQAIACLKGAAARYLGPGLAVATFLFMLLAVIWRLLVFGA